MKGNQLMRKPKLLRALLILLFVAAPIQWTRAQIVLSTPKTTLGAVIKNIKSQSNYQFFYDDKLAEMPVNAIDVKNGSLQSVLDAALQGKGITYKIEDNIVYLSASGEPPAPRLILIIKLLYKLHPVIHPYLGNDSLIIIIYIKTLSFS